MERRLWYRRQRNVVDLLLPLTLWRRRRHGLGKAYSGQWPTSMTCPVNRYRRKSNIEHSNRVIRIYYQREWDMLAKLHEVQENDIRSVAWKDGSFLEYIDQKTWSPAKEDTDHPNSIIELAHRYSWRLGKEYKSRVDNDKGREITIEWSRLFHSYTTSHWIAKGWDWGSVTWNSNVWINWGFSKELVSNLTCWI